MVTLTVAARLHPLGEFSCIETCGAEALGRSPVIYDPSLHTEQVRRNWFGLSIQYGDGRSEVLNAVPR